MQLQNSFQKITSFIKKKGFKELKLNHIIETKYIRGVNLKKYLFTFNDDKGESFSLRPDLSLMSLIQFSKTKIKKDKKFFKKGNFLEKKKINHNRIVGEIKNLINNKKT